MQIGGNGTKVSIWACCKKVSEIFLKVNLSLPEHNTTTLAYSISGFNHSSVVICHVVGLSMTGCGRIPLGDSAVCK